jgi:hypothetical protein
MSNTQGLDQQAILQLRSGKPPPGARSYYKGTAKDRRGPRQSREGAGAILIDQRRSPVTTKSIRRLPHWAQTSRLCQSGTVISAP